MAHTKGGPQSPPFRASNPWPYLPTTKVSPTSPEPLYFASPAGNSALSVYDPGFRINLALADAFPFAAVVPTPV